jgi:hypothetical protein
MQENPGRRESDENSIDWKSRIAVVVKVVGLR